MSTGKDVQLVAVDPPGIQMVIEACKKAETRKLSLMSGLCRRHSPPVRETMDRVLGGDIGEIIGIQSNYVVGARRAYRNRPEWTEMQNQIFNWYNFRRLSGDLSSAQLIHRLDIASWGMRDVPPKSD